MLPMTPVICSTSHRTRVATSIAIAIASDSRNDIFMTDHGSMFAIVRRTVRGPFFEDFPLILTPLEEALTPPDAFPPWSGPEPVEESPPLSRRPPEAELTRVCVPAEPCPPEDRPPDPAPPVGPLPVGTVAVGALPAEPEPAGVLPLVPAPDFADPSASPLAVSRVRPLEVRRTLPGFCSLSLTAALHLRCRRPAPGEPDRGSPPRPLRLPRR